MVDMVGPGNRIRELREEKGWSLEEFAEKCNTTNQQISRLERGQRELTLRWMMRLALALDCPIVDLLPADLASIGRPPPPSPPVDSQEQIWKWLRRASVLFGLGRAVVDLIKTFVGRLGTPYSPSRATA